ncbi:MAG TPA: 3-methyl-2-oxobutanoate hydroxymethyltransferase [bacterium]|nr:3-methyl-2-oxobutanoate hydroxymethyltransferase [bacterium]
MSGKVTILEIQGMKARGERIVMLTAYDYPSAMIADACGIDMILVGDSVGTVIQGVSTTLPVTMEQMLYHTELVARARKRAMVVFDMPFMSYQESLEQARHNAGLAVKVAGAEAVKLEGGANMAPVIEAIAGIDIPVVAHIGLTPQSIHRMGGYKVQGKGKDQGRKLLADARAVERAGAFCLVMECIPAPLAREITAALKIPTIGIGCGPHCSGQVLVWHDILGVYPGRKMTMVKKYADLHAVISDAVSAYAKEVREGSFPGPEHCFGPAPAKPEEKKKASRKK